MRQLAAVCLTLAAACITVSAVDREWQMGTWAKALEAPKVGTPYRNYAIETDKVRLDLQETTAPGRQAIPDTAGSAVTFAVEGDQGFVKQGDAERPLRLIKRSEKLRAYPAPGAGHYIKAIANQGLTITLEDNSVWDIDPRGQYKTERWEALQGISVRPVPADNGFNYEIGNLDVDEGILGRLAPP